MSRPTSAKNAHRHRGINPRIRFSPDGAAMAVDPDAETGIGPSLPPRRKRQAGLQLRAIELLLKNVAFDLGRYQIANRTPLPRPPADVAGADLNQRGRNDMAVERSK